MGSTKNFPINHLAALLSHASLAQNLASIWRILICLMKTFSAYFWCYHKVTYPNFDPQNQRHATTLYLSADGHFGLMQKSKNNDPEDLSLLEGKGFFPPEGPYQDYIMRAGESKDVGLNSYHAGYFIKIQSLEVHMCKTECA
jgi:hypothetical protein